MRSDGPNQPLAALQQGGGGEAERKQLEAECHRLQLLVGELLLKNEDLRSELRSHIPFVV
jgi:hypothetical protein